MPHWTTKKLSLKDFHPKMKKVEETDYQDFILWRQDLSKTLPKKLTEEEKEKRWEQDSKKLTGGLVINRRFS